MMKEVYELAKMHKVSTCVTTSLNNMAYYYSRQQQYDEAAPYLEECLQAFETYNFKEDDLARLGIIHHLAEVSLACHDEERYLQCIAMHEAFPKKRSQRRSYHFQCCS